MTLITPFPTFHYHPHQEEGIQWMLERERDGSFCHGGILADEMGLGKTWETIGLLLNNPLRHTLLLVPPVLQQQWIDALKLAGICICVLRSESHEMGPWYIVDGERKDVYVLLATYDRAAASVEHILEAAEIDRIVADEGHTFRNDKTRRFKILSQIKAKCRWILSGTPVQNRVNDFHNLLTWLNEDYVKENYVLHEIAAKLILRRTAAEVREAVPEFPECKPLHFIHPVAYVDGTKEKKVFDTLVQRFKYVIEHQMEQWMVLELYLRIRQFTAHPQIYYDAMHKKYPEQARIVWEETVQRLLHSRRFSANLTSALRWPLRTSATRCTMQRSALLRLDTPASVSVVA
jgi:SNF2 family DNA or RNA helicase